MGAPDVTRGTVLNRVMVDRRQLRAGKLSGEVPVKVQAENPESGELILLSPNSP